MNFRALAPIVCAVHAVFAIGVAPADPSGGGAVRASGRRSPDLRVRFLAPDEWRAVNTRSLTVRVALEASSPRGAEGTIRLLTLLVDGRVAGHLDATQWHASRVFADFRVPLSALADGAHYLEAQATFGNGRHESLRSDVRTFVIDRTLPVLERNRIEDAATPLPFATFTARLTGNPRDTGGVTLTGEFRASLLSDGWQLAGERLVISLGSATHVIDAGEMRCVKRMTVCHWESRDRDVRRVILHRSKDGRWQFLVQARQMSTPSLLFLRIGNDWGGVKLDTGERLDEGTPAIDTEAAVERWVGPAGGTIETTDARGVLVRLDIPRAALVADTLITLSPLAESPLVGAAAAQRGVRFEPSGLVFARPAVLTLDYSNTDHVVTEHEQIFLLTSPLTALPLPGVTDPAAGTVTAFMHHFSTTLGGLTARQWSDLTTWAEPILGNTDELSLTELESLLALARAQLATGCDSGRCISLSEVAARAGASIAGLAVEACAFDIGMPTDAALQRWVALQAVAQDLGVADTGHLAGCIEQVLRSLIIDAPGPDGALTDADIQRLLRLARRAQGLGYGALDTLALNKAARIVRARLADQIPLCAIDASHARDRMNETLALAQGFATGVDPTLEGDILAAITACSSGTGTGGGGGAPPPVLAPGCDQDVLAPTELALANWRVIEVQGTARGADVSAVRTCENDLLGALIARATVAAQADASDANLQRLVSLGATAADYGFPGHQSSALTSLAHVLRTLLAQAACAADTVAAQAIISRVLAWAPSVAAVDGSLAADAQAALGACQPSSSIRARVLAQYTSAWAQYVTETGTELVVATLGGSFCCDSFVPASYGADTSIPVTLRASAGGGAVSGEWTLRQTSPSTLEWSARIDGYVTAPLLNFEITLTQPGTIVFEANNASWPADLQGAQMEAVLTPYLEFPYSESATVYAAIVRDGFGFPWPATSTVVFPAGVHRFSLRHLIHGPYPATNGWLIRLTYTP